MLVSVPATVCCVVWLTIARVCVLIHDTQPDGCGMQWFGRSADVGGLALVRAVSARAHALDSWWRAFAAEPCVALVAATHACCTHDMARGGSEDGTFTPLGICLNLPSLWLALRRIPCSKPQKR